MTLTEIARLSEDEARTYLENIRWPHHLACPHCGSVSVTRLHGKKHRPGVIQCNDCREQFTLTVGSIMEDSHIPLQKWILAFHLLCSSKKGFSALQLQRELGIGSYRTALFMLHRIRAAMSDTSKEVLRGTVEMDETYVGGKPRPGDGKVHKRGLGTLKTPVVVAVERNGEAESRPVPRVTTKALQDIADDNIDPAATLMTDDLALYDKVGKGFAGGHATVNHTNGEYARRIPGGLTAHTNTAESFFSLLKRGHYGVYHRMSSKHLHRYCDEFSFRWDHRKVNDSQRTEAAIQGAKGKRLTYRGMVEGNGRPA